MAEFQPPSPGFHDEEPEHGEPVIEAPEQHLPGVLRAVIAVVVSLAFLALVPLGLMMRTMEDMRSGTDPSYLASTLDLEPGNYVIVVEIETPKADISDGEWPDAGCAIMEADGTPVVMTVRTNALPAPIRNGSEGTYRFGRVVGSFTLTQANPSVSCSYAVGSHILHIHPTTAWYAALGLDVLGFLVAVVGICGVLVAVLCAVKPGKFRALIIQLVSIPVGLSLIALIGTLILRSLAR
ncbi:MAG: hypothetical protein LBM94_07085 [Propionibacteriaceae bacterium]|nr:hypothetical protein [Propionibacteriaceae bacterium]